MQLRKEQMGDHFVKYHIDGLPFPAVIHHISAPDEGLPHDHPFGFRSYILRGWYVERVYFYNGVSYVEKHKEGKVFEVDAGKIHKIIEVSEGGCWTLIIPGPWERHCGFWEFKDGQGTFHPAPPPPINT